jgi:HK97 family phage portal protein
VSLFRREVRQWAPEPTVPPFPNYGGGFGAPTVDRALQVSAVWACVRLLADSVSMMPLSAYTMRGSIRVPTPAPQLLLKPSADATMSEWVYMLMASLLLRGNGYGRIVRRDSLGYPIQIELLHPDCVSVTTDSQTGSLVYRVNGEPLKPEDVFHVRAFRMPGSRLGLSPIAYAARSINTDSAAADFGLGFFRDGAHPSAILSSDANFTQEQTKTIKERFVAAINGREPAVLSGGLKYEQVQVSPDESQFLDTQKYGVAQIARIFGVPPELIAGEAGNSMTYANVEQRGIDFLTYSVQPWLTRLESTLATLLPGQRHVRFDTSVLTRTDFSTLMTATSVGIASKQMTVDEARAKRDEPPLTDEQKTDLALVPMDVSASGKPKLLPPAAPAPEGEPA